ncbi:hypothetical protein HPP92_022515 [Vanilla planifolia]|uniref:C2 domain-containing protein n=1 Tax=Vanilla planifolia TaxID=51239 RepID=A0A835Q0R2_VANPL|nr:hypothetical protein HPP92_022515 [Vanilla planifolia]
MGTKDGFTSVKQLENKLKSAAGRVETHLLEGVGHFQMEGPAYDAQMVDLIVHFIQSLQFQLDSMQNPPSHEDYSLKEASPHLGSGCGERLATKYDLVEQMLFLYVRVVKAKQLCSKDGMGSSVPYVAVRVGNFRGITRHIDKKDDPEWNQVFAFSKDSNLASMIEVTLNSKDCSKDEPLGIVTFEMSEIPERVPPDSPLAPQWYKLEDHKGNKVDGELMLAVWIGSQADEAFPEACHSDAACISKEHVVNLRSKVYVSPKLWYVRANVIEAQDLQPCDKTRFPEVYAKVVVGNQALRTKTSQNKSINHMWNEDLMFVVAEPFEEQVVISVHDKVGPNKDEVIGMVSISLQKVERRMDSKALNSKWYILEKNLDGDDCWKKKKRNEANCSGRIRIRICLDGGYHVLDESTNYSSDFKPTGKQLWQPSIGVLELGILGAQGLLPTKTKDGRGTTNAYCVAKYGQKWVRTRTVVDNLSPKWNEQYTWEVYEPCTVVTIGVFDNCQLQSGENPSPQEITSLGKLESVSPPSKAIGSTSIGILFLF